MSSISKLNDEDLLASLATLNSNEVETVARILVHLMEVGKRRLYAVKGHSSLFSYCVEALNYCEGTAGRRVTAARCVEKFPSILKLFLDQKLNLTTIVMISKIITKENKNEVLKAVCNKRKSEVEKYVATFLPEKSIRESIKALPSFPKGLDSRKAQLINSIKFSVPKERHPRSEEFSSAQVSSAQVIEITQESSSAGGVGNVLKTLEFSQNFEIKIKARESSVNKLRRVQELRGVKESLGDLFEVLLDQYLQRHSPEARSSRRKARELRLAERQKGVKRVTPASTDTSLSVSARYVSTKTKDELHLEQNSQCAFIAFDGTRCTCRIGLQVDHIYPFGLGGSNDKQNLRLLCRTHNRYAAEGFYGEDKMRGFFLREISAQYAGQEENLH